MHNERFRKNKNIYISFMCIILKIYYAQKKNEQMK